MANKNSAAQGILRRRPDITVTVTTADVRHYFFYSASALLAMPTAVIATADVPVCPSRSCVVQKKEDTIMRF